MEMLRSSGPRLAGAVFPAAGTAVMTKFVGVPGMLAEEPANAQAAAARTARMPVTCILLIPMGLDAGAALRVAGVQVVSST